MNDLILDAVYMMKFHLQYPRTNLYFTDLCLYEIIILIAYGIMIIVSFFANAICIIVFTLVRRSRSELSPFLLNLSIFNIIMTVYCIPFTILSFFFQRWLFGHTFCLIFDGFKTFSVCGVLLTLIAIAVDRYCAVKRPFTIRVSSIRRRNYMLVPVIWAFSIALSAIWFPVRSIPMDEKRLWVSSRRLLKKYVDIDENDISESTEYELLHEFQYKLVDTVQCEPNRRSQSMELRLSILNSLQTYFIPLTIVGFVYLRIAFLLWHRSNEERSSMTDIVRPRAREQSASIHQSLSFRRKLQHVSVSAMFLQLRSR